MKSVPQNRRMRMPPPPEEESDDEEFDEEFEDDEFDEEDDEDEGELAELMEAYLSHEDDNVCSAMLKVAKQLETTNRLLVKMISAGAPSPQRKEKPRRRPVVEESSASEEEAPEAVDLTDETEA